MISKLLNKTKSISNTQWLLLGLFLFGVACGPNKEQRTLQEKITEINTQMQETLQKMDELPNEPDLNNFNDKTTVLLGSLDSQIEEYHLLMDKTNQVIDKEARDRIIRIKQKKAEIEFKLALLEDAGAYIRESKEDTLTYADTVLTSRNASGSAVTHELEPLATDETEVGTMTDTLMTRVRMNQWQYGGKDFRTELLDDLEKIKAEAELFRKRNLQ